MVILPREKRDHIGVKAADGRIIRERFLKKVDAKN